MLYADTTRIHFSRKKSIALLSYLALQPGAHGRDTLATLLWPMCGQKQARANLRTCLFEITAALAPETMIAGRETISLLPNSLQADAVEFIRNLAPCPGHKADIACEACVPGILEAIGLYRGPFMAGFTLSDSEGFDEWETSRENELGEAYVSALSRAAAWHAAQGETTKAIEKLRLLRAADPYDEDALRSLMRFLAESGKAAAAIDIYREFETLARKDLGIGPEEETEALCREIKLDHVTPGLGTLIVGRTDAEAEIRATLMSHKGRLCTITGMGGIGKTRLARGIIASPGGYFPDGTVFVDLSAIADPAMVLPEIASSLHVSQRSLSKETIGARIAAHIGDRRFLLALDNFEQVLPAAASVRSLILSCPGLVVLATSRVALGVEGEAEIPLSPLTLPRDPSLCTLEDIDRYTSLRLFVDRASTADPDFRIATDSAALVAEICSRLEGLPLAIELAASRLSSMSLEELGERIKRSFAIVKAGEGAPARAGASERPPRHRSLHEAVAWSWRLLASGERRFLQRLSVFRGGFDLDAAEAVCGESTFDGGVSTLDRLDALNSWHLIAREDAEGRKRYRLPEAIRSFAEEELDRGGSSAALRRLHALYYLKLAKSLAAALHGPYQRKTLLRMEREHGNWVSAQDFLVERDMAAEALDLCDSLEWYWYRSGRFAEGRIMLSKVFGMAAAERFKAARGRAVRACAWLDLLVGDWGGAFDRYREAVAILRETDDISGLARALSGLGVIERWMGETECGLAHGMEAVRLVTPTRNALETARALIWVFANTGGRKVSDGQEEGLGEALALAREASDPWLEAHALEGLGDFLRENADAASSIPCYEESLKLFEEVEDDWMLAWVHEGLGMAALRAGQHDMAEARLFRSVELFRALGDRGDVAYVLGELGLASEARGDQDRADFLFGVFFSLFKDEYIASALPRNPAAPFEGLPRAAIPAPLAPSVAKAASRSAQAWRRGCISGLDGAIEFLSGSGSSRIHPISQTAADEFSRDARAI